MGSSNALGEQCQVVSPLYLLLLPDALPHAVVLLDRYVNALCSCLEQVLQTAVANGNKQHHEVVTMVMEGE